MHAEEEASLWNIYPTEARVFWGAGGGGSGSFPPGVRVFRRGSIMACTDRVKLCPTAQLGGCIVGLGVQLPRLFLHGLGAGQIFPRSDRAELFHADTYILHWRDVVTLSVILSFFFLRHFVQHVADSYGHDDRRSSH